MAKEMVLSENIKLVSFETKDGIFVYVGNKVIGCLTLNRIVDQCKI